jgi:hypothetical protein
MDKAVEKKRWAAGEEKAERFAVRYDKFEDGSYGEGEGA